MEANQEKRDRYLEEIKHLSPEELVYLDESGIEVTSVKDRGWGKKGKLLIGKKSGKYYQRINILSGYVNKHSIAPLVFNGICNTELFDKWVERFLIKELKPGQVVVMDNATFHKSGKVKTLIESVGCRVVFLPPYSPDLNPIEKFWANMKRWLAENLTNFTSIFDALSKFFSYD